MSRESVSRLERLIVELAGSGSVVFVFGVGWWTAHLRGETAPVFHGELNDRRWHVEVGDSRCTWVMDVKLGEVSDVRFVREPNPFPRFPGQESLTVHFVGPHNGAILYCYLDDLYDENRRLLAERLEDWTRLRDRYAGDAAAA
jgi:hypothetical protein